MRYHPDRNPEPRAAEAFILVNEAYAYLSDTDRRQDAERPLTGRERDDERRKARYADWEAYQREAARRRAEAYARGKVEEFEQSRVFKAAMVMDRFYNYLFIGIGIFIAVMPVIGTQFLTEEEKAEFNYFSLIIPIVLGTAFVYGIWYFVFNLEDE